MKPPRGLSAEEAAAWARLAATVKPLRKVPPASGERDHAKDAGGSQAEAPNALPKSKPPLPLHPRPAAGGSPPRSGEERVGLDSTWERKLSRGTLAPDFTLDLHGHTLSSAHGRLDHGLTQAKALGVRVVLVITGKARPTEAADRGHQRGAIRAKILDWLAAGPHASSIAAVRHAHRRHGGEGALYLILKRRG